MGRDIGKACGNEKVVSDGGFKHIKVIDRADKQGQRSCEKRDILSQRHLFSGKLVTGPKTAHSAKELCESNNSLGRTSSPTTRASSTTFPGRSFTPSARTKSRTVAKRTRRTP
ncbi:hypothetical protein PG995_015472 [Apiospora arundinis]